MAKRFTILLIIVLILVISIGFWIRHNNTSLEGLGLKILCSTVSTPPRYDFDSPSQNELAPAHTIWDQDVAKYVDDQGWVDYSRWKENTTALDNYLNLLTNHPPRDSWAESEELAYWINAYNAFTIKLILDHYPLESIKDIGGSIPMYNTVWDQKFFKIGARLTSLGEIEHLILRKYFNEPRIHFAINCASISCPVLRTEAYTSFRLEEQLADQSKLFINDETKNELDANEVLRLSPIFKWFSEDFGSKNEVKKLISTYSLAEVSEHSPIKYLEYNWSLNEN